MKFIIRKFYSGYCTYNIEADNENKAWNLVKQLPIDYEQIHDTLEPWEECDEIENDTTQTAVTL